MKSGALELVVLYIISVDIICR